MSLSIQTNIASLDAQNAIAVNTQFQNNTIEQLSSGYRINSSADDAAGLAVANQYAASTAELTQGVLNATNGTSALQIVDGGLSNITTILNRLTTLATESASSTFTGNRTTLNNEYQGLLTEINRQASNVGLNTGGTNNANLTTYIGGGSNAANAQVDVNLAGNQNAVDSKGLGIATTSILGGGAELSGNPAAVNNVNLANTATVFLAGQSQQFNFNIGVAGPNGVIASQAEAITVTGGANGLTGDQVITSLNNSLSQYGISASIAADGTLQFGGTANFSVATVAATGGNAVATALSQTINTSNYNVSSTAGAGAAVVTGLTAGTETLLFQNGAGTTSVTLNDSVAGTFSGSNGVYTGSADNITDALATLNTALNGTGISAVKDALGTSITFQSTNVFSLSGTTSGETGNILGAGRRQLPAPRPGLRVQATPSRRWRRWQRPARIWGLPRARLARVLTS